ncbi:MAG: hypothetical protein A3J75_01400 [Acidobacteria bacterium RBG_16_68_9]|nr:MAG: hypothetical protein A3J75_01400 [Acidobacteria bacterium RBG_16_68_9]
MISSLIVSSLRRSIVGFADRRKTTAHHAAARRWIEGLPDQVVTHTDAVSLAVVDATRCTAAMSFDHDFVTGSVRL